MSKNRDWAVWRCGISMTLATLRTAGGVLRDQPHERMPFLAGALDVACERIESMAKEIEELHKKPRGEIHSLPVLEIIDNVLSLIRVGPFSYKLRSQLEELRDSIWLELPEDRCRLLCRVGEILNSHYDSMPRELFWEEIKAIMESAFEEFRR